MPVISLRILIRTTLSDICAKADDDIRAAKRPLPIAQTMDLFFIISSLVFLLGRPCRLRRTIDRGFRVAVFGPRLPHVRRARGKNRGPEKIGWPRGGDLQDARVHEPYSRVIVLHLVRCKIP